jgi:hypothetical protein
VTIQSARPDVRSLRASIRAGQISLSASTLPGRKLLDLLFGCGEKVTDVDGSVWVTTGIAIG